MKDKYIDLCKANEAIPVFGQAWFLDIVCDNSWSVSLAFDKEGKVSGAWPYMFRKRKGFSFLQMPDYTPYLGPYIYYPKHINSEYKRNSFYFQTVQALEGQLPRASYTCLKLSPENDTWYPLYSKAYKQTSRYTYVIDHKIGLEKITSNLKPQLRNVVSKGDYASISEDYTPFLELLKQTFSEKGITRFYHEDKIRRLIETAVSHEQGTLYTYKDMDSGIFVLEDQEKCYLLFTTTNSKGKSEEGVAQLIWKAIKDAVGKGKDFDFEGSMLPGVEKFFRSFGGKQEAFHEVKKINSPMMKLYKFLRP